MTTMTIPLPKPHSVGQRDIILYPGNSVCFAGRRWGKTQAGVERILLEGQKANRRGIYWWVGLSWRSASMKRAWRLIKYYARQTWQTMGLDWAGHIREVDKEAHLPNGTEIWLRTAEKQESLAGEGIRGAVLDEFSLMRETVWTEYIQPALLDFNGWALFVGVPKGNNWATKLYRHSKTLNNWRSFHFTTYDNPFIPEARIDEMRNTMPERLFEQEILAQIIEGAGLVFRNIEACMGATLEPTLEEHKDHYLVMGVDWGKHQDYTVLSLGCADCCVELARDRFSQIDYTLQRGRLIALAERWKPMKILAESNAMGEPIIELLADEGLPVEGFQTTASSKPQLIENFALAFERAEWQFQDDPIWTLELEAYERDVSSATGRSRYGAPEGMHDDTVMARALMLWAAGKQQWLIY